jgi:hypothetical protein
VQHVHLRLGLVEDLLPLLDQPVRLGERHLLRELRGLHRGRRQVHRRERRRLVLHGELRWEGLRRL